MKIPKYILEIDENKIPLLVAEEYQCFENLHIKTTKDAVEVAEKGFRLSRKAEEHLVMIATVSGCVTALFSVTHGTYNFAQFSPREIFIRLLLSGAGEFILLHNHPGASIDISREDELACRRMKDAANLIGMKLLDFIIVSSDGTNYCSFADENLL